MKPLGKQAYAHTNGTSKIINHFKPKRGKSGTHISIIVAKRPKTEPNIFLLHFNMNQPFHCLPAVVEPRNGLL